MLDKNTIVKVTNRTRSNVVYRVPDLNVRRVFTPGEVKDISMDELRKLSYTNSGKVLLTDYLVIDNKEAVMELVGKVEPEYYYSPDKVKELLLTGNYDAFLDCLDFAPDGVIDLIKDYAVKFEINDIQKREAILKKTGFNVTKAIEINHESEKLEEEIKTRRVAVETNSEDTTTEEKTPIRRVTIVK